VVLNRLLGVYLFLSLIVLSASVASPQERRAALISEITMLEQAGVRLHRTTHTPYTTRYVLQVHDERNATRSLIQGWSAGMIDPRGREAMADWLRDGRWDVKIDWNRYLGHQERSVRVTFRGNAKSQKYPALQRWLDAGGLGVWLSFGEGDRLSRATLLPIDTNISENNTTWQWRMQGYDLRITRSHPTHRYDRAAHLTGGEFFLRQTDADTTQTTLRIDKITCQADRHAREDGSLACAVPHVALTQGETELIIADVTFDQAMQERNASKVGTMHGRIKHLNLQYHEEGDEGNISLRELRGEVNASVSDTLAYRAHTTLESFHASMLSRGDKKIEVDGCGIVYGSGIKNLYNFLPKLDAMTQGSKLSEVDGNVTRDERWYMEEILAEVIHHGATARIAPFRIESLRMHGEGIDHDFTKTKLLVKATLAPNSIDVRRSSAPMRMPGYLKVKGRWEMRKHDYDYLLSVLPVKIRLLVTIFARRVKDKVIFELEFDRGHLRINGQQVM
jgi:hypothetical protein